MLKAYRFYVHSEVIIFAEDKREAQSILSKHNAKMPCADDIPLDDPKPGVLCANVQEVEFIGTNLV
jgi:hypothetical protein